MDEKTRQEFLAQINEVVDWLYADGENAPKNTYLEKIRVFKSIGDPIKQRQFYFSELDVYFHQFQEITNTIQSQIGGLSDLQRDAVLKKHNAAMDLMSRVEEGKKTPHLTPSVPLEEII